MRKGYIVFCASILITSGTVYTAHGQSGASCFAFPSNSTPASGYGVSWDVFDSAKGLLVKTNCPTSGTTLTVTIGRGDTTHAVYNRAYSYRPDLSTASAWREHTLTGTALGTGWLTGQGTVSITAPSTASVSNPMYFVGYVCANSSGTWKCGCDSVACTTPKWQLQGYTGIVSTGGGTGATGGWNGGEFTPPSFYQTVKNTAARMCYSPTNTRVLTPGSSTITQGGTATNPLVYVPSGAFSGGSLAINAQYVVLKGGTFNGTALRINASNVRLTENRIFAPHNGQAINIASQARNVRIDRNIIDAGNSTEGEDIEIDIADGATNPYYHRIDHNLFTGGAPGDDGGLNIYLGLVNKQRESLSRTLVEKNYIDASGRKYGFYVKSMENVIENNVITGGESRTGVRHGGRNIFFQNHLKGNTGLFTFDTDNYFVSNILDDTRQGFWIGSGDCTFSAGDCLPGAGEANHPNAVRTKAWGNKFVDFNHFRLGYLEFKLEGGRAQRCPEGVDLEGNSRGIIGVEGCATPVPQSFNTNVSPQVVNLSKAQVGPSGEADYLCQ